MTEQDSAIFGAVLITAVIVSFFWITMWCLVTIERLKKEVLEDVE